MQVIDRIAELGIIPVVKIDDVKNAIHLVESLRKAHLNCIEVTFRTNAAVESIKAISKQYPDFLIGAGTVLTCKQVDEAILAGAKFIVTPGFNPDTVSYCIGQNIPIIPGCSNALDIESALSFGLKVVKFFPAEQLGGLPMIKALAGPYGNVEFIATGGINEKNFRSYLDFPKVIAIAGSWMVSSELIEKESFGEIEKLSKAALSVMLGLEIQAIAFDNLTTSSEKNELQLWNEATNGLLNSSNESISKGVITIRTLDIRRAIAYFRNSGMEFENDSVSKNDNTLKEIFFKNRLDGFMIRLMQK